MSVWFDCVVCCVVAGFVIVVLVGFDVCGPLVGVCFVCCVCVSW